MERFPSCQTKIFSISEHDVRLAQQTKGKTQCPLANATQEALEPPTPVPAGEGLNLLLHRTPPKWMVAPPESEAPEIREASTVSWWAGRLLTYHHSIFTGNTYTWAAQLSVNSSLQFDFYGFSGQTYGGGPCERSVLDHIVGPLGVHTTPSLWLDLPGNGEEYWKDSCNPAVDQTIPVNIDYRWLVTVLDQGLTQLRFQNAKYRYAFNDFVMKRIK